LDYHRMNEGNILIHRKTIREIDDFHWNFPNEINDLRYNEIHN
jgi:hypothetical protein